MTSGSSKSGISIQRGIEIAIDEINGAGGLLGRPLELVVKDHRGNPARGVDNIADFAKIENLVAVVGGLHTPVALSELEEIHKNEVIYLSPWAAGTPVVENGYDPNFVFRVSVRDEYAGGFLVRKALDRGFTRIALALEQTGWGRSNETAMLQALKAEGLKPVAVRWFHWGAQHMQTIVTDIVDTKADVILFVGNAPEGKAIVRAIAEGPEMDRVPLISHWGITGGDFYETTREYIELVDLTFLQTYSFLKPTHPDRARKVIDQYVARYPDASSNNDIIAPVGTAHAYDLVHLLAQAIRQAQSIDRPAVRSTLENLEPYEGLVRDYQKPFSVENHDALEQTDFHLAEYGQGGVIALKD
jgi:branched-chain amino acid transport system substrate-binding protein